MTHIIQHPTHKHFFLILSISVSFSHLQLDDMRNTLVLMLSSGPSCFPTYAGQLDQLWICAKNASVLVLFVCQLMRIQELNLFKLLTC